MFWSTFTCFFFHCFLLFTPSARVFSYSCSFSFSSFFSARCSWPSSNQSPNDATTHLLFTLIRSILLSYVFFTLMHSFFLSRSHDFVPYSLFSLALSPHTRRSIFLHVCVCVRSFLLFFIFVCVSSFIDYLNVTTKLDISTSSNKLGFCFFNVCVFPFILNISLLFFKRLKLRIFYPSFDRALLFPPPLCFVYFFFLFVWHKIIFCNFHCFFLESKRYTIFAGCYNFNFLFSIRIITQNTRRGRSLIDLHCFIECVCVYVFLCVCEWVCKAMTKVIAYVYVCVYLFTWFIISFRS